MGLQVSISTINKYIPDAVKTAIHDFMYLATRISVAQDGVRILIKSIESFTESFTKNKHQKPHC